MRTSHRFVLVFAFFGGAACGGDDTTAGDTRDTTAGDTDVDSDVADDSDATATDSRTDDADADDLADADADDSADAADTTDTGDAGDTGDTSDTAGDASDTDDADDADATDATAAAPAFYLTIAEVPPEMNGSRPSQTPDGELSFRLRANRAHVDLDVLALPASGPFGVDDLDLECLAGDAPASLPSAIEVAPGHLRVTLDAAHALPDGAAVDCSATITNAAGASTATYSFDAATLPAELDPFPATDVWLVLLHRDRDTVHVTDNGNGTSELRSTRQPDGIDDFDAPFIEVGLMPADDPEAAAAIRDHLLRKVKAIVHAIYGLDDAGVPTADGIDLRLYFEGDAGAPDPADYGSPDHRFSMIALTGDGDAEDQAGTTFGRALIDWNNQDTQDDTIYGLGVWPAAIARTILRNAAAGLLLADIRPAFGGTPFGAAPGDELFIGQDVDWVTLPDAVQGRAQRYELLVRFGSLALAAILSHEMGHSLGLVPYGPPPIGMFAGVETDWVVSLAPDSHIDIPGLNVMQTGASVNWLEAATGDLPRFEPLSWAYLRRQLVVGPQPD